MIMPLQDKFHVVVIGGGASGLMAAGRAAECGASVLLLERMDRLGLKLLISGKGRCNLTNSGETENFLANFSRTGNFLRPAFHRFFNTDLMKFFESRGLDLKVERGGRIFPETDQAHSVLHVFQQYLDKYGVKSRLNTRVRTIETEKGRVCGVTLSDESFVQAERIILATGGMSYPGTGSSGDGYKMARKLGHLIQPLKAALVPLVVKENYVRDLMGLSLKNVKATVFSSGKAAASEFGEMLFTHFGLSGPIILSLSSTILDLLEETPEVVVSIDLKPALSPEKLHARIIRETNTFGRKSLKNYLPELLPSKIIPIFLYLLGTAPEKKLNHLERAERERLVFLLKDFRLTVNSSRPIEEAIVTRGGISVREIDPRTMESKKTRGLYLCGEVIDVDARTGGYNLQTAFSTGFLAGESAAKN